MPFNYLCMSYRLDNVYHVAVMPCYDKKLEAARDNFAFSIHEGENGPVNSVTRIPEVDSVLTTGEVLDLIQVWSTPYHHIINIYFLNHINH